MWIGKKFLKFWVGWLDGFEKNSKNFCKFEKAKNFYVIIWNFEKQKFTNLKKIPKFLMNLEIQIICLLLKGEQY